MAYQYTISECRDYLRVEVHGSRNGIDVTRESLRMWQIVAQRCQSKGINLILAVFHLTGTRDMIDTFNIVEGVQEWLWPELAIAYVDMNADNRKENTIVEQSAMMHGINFRIFYNEDDGTRWLNALQSTHRH
ncbi:hypothetical protein [uncultured Amphritea sp.]|uniref:hypothetical protein n=1 Tax=uncultured Amphritea sp. TaxID=981605 RepID=UPI00260C0E69|nr:hypothetical protein [uncultured Amphritea sp.]